MRRGAASHVERSHGGGDEPERAGALAGHGHVMIDVVVRWMRRPRQDESGADPVGDFWSWWRERGAAATAEALDAGRVDGVADLVGPRVGAIDPGLAWDLVPGVSSRSALVVSADGDPALRRTARRWLAGAPEPDEEWSFHDLRPAGAVGATLDVGGVPVDLGEVTVAGERHGSALDVVVHHPRFPGLDEEARRRVTFHALDAALGEELVELWLGTVATSDEPPPAGRPLSELPALLAPVVDDAAPDGEMGWALLHGTTESGPAIAIARNRLSPVQAPLLSQVATVVLPFTDRTAAGLPEQRTQDALQALEDRLIAAVAHHGMLLATETCGGTRWLHFAVDPEGPGAELLRSGVADWSQGEGTVDVTDDPEWEAVAHLEG